MYYILENKVPKKVDNLVEWSKKFNHNKIVDQTYIGDIFISTVFLGLDHSFHNNTPILFETMIFGGEHDGFQERYATWDEAYEGHHRACAMVVG